jgi:formylglycine-generating enzyme required for sulfatase activity
VQEFLQKASALTGLSLRLPTEAEWEYAAGGGKAHQKWAGTNNESDLGEYAWYNANAGGKTHPVCQKKPNLFGLCDMSGNVWEFCSDTYSAQYYAQSPSDNPTGPDKGPKRMARGGCWNYVPSMARTTNRDWFDTGSYTTIGFRVVTP